MLAVVSWAFWLPPAASGQGYEIGNGDVLTVSVVGQPELSGEFPVDAAGMLALPVLGKVKAAGLTPGALERKLVTLLSDGYLKRPEVAVRVKEYRSQRVFVTGELNRPGPYALKGDRTLLTLMGDIGPLQPDAGHEVIVIRPPEGGEDAAPVEDPVEGPAEGPVEESPRTRLPNEVPGSEILRANLRELLSGNPAKNLELRPGDTVFLPKAANVYVTGHVAKPGPVRFEEGMTVYQALTLAGGINDKGSDKVKIVRLVDGKRVETKAKMGDLLLPEDTLRVPEKFF